VSATQEERAAAIPAENYRDAPPVGEEIHIPGPTLIPLVMAVGITLIVVGTTINWLFTIIGGIIFIVTLVRWIRDTRRDVSALPDEHH
jgi:hypothetical protein